MSLIPTGQCSEAPLAKATSIKEVDFEERPQSIVFTVQTQNREPGMPGYVEHRVSASLFPDPLLVARRDGKILIAQEDTKHSGPFYLLTVESEHDLPGPLALVANTEALLYKIEEAREREGLFVQPVLYTKALHDGLRLFTPDASFKETNSGIERAKKEVPMLREIDLREISLYPYDFSLGIITNIEIG